MKCALVLLLLLCLVSQNSLAHSRRTSKRKPDPSYTAALATANRFLHAWQSEDHEAGIVMLSDSARQHASPEQLQSFFSPGPNAAYEITHGKRTKMGTYVFPAVLFSSPELPHPHVGVIIVSRDGKSDWTVDKLP